MERKYEFLDICKVKKLAEKISEVLKENDVLAFLGEVGAGKTTFIRFLCENLGIKDEVTSPTFSILNEYNGKFKIYHYDMYRINSLDDLESIGFFDTINVGALVIIEWSENIVNYLPKNTVYITIDRCHNENYRDISIEGLEY